jgi:hypothetical protein
MAASRIEHCRRENERVKTIIEKPVFFTGGEFRQEFLMDKAQRSEKSRKDRCAV